MCTALRLLMFLWFMMVPPVLHAKQWVHCKLDNHSSIDFPVKPDSVSAEGKTIISAHDGLGLYTLVKTVVKESDLDGAYLDLAYSALEEELRKNEKDTGMSVEAFSLNQQSGKKFAYHIVGSDPQRFAITRAFYFNGTLYAYTYAGKEDDVTKAAGFRFLNSFSINTDLRMIPKPAIGCATDIDFLWGHIVFAGFFAVLAFTLYFIWTRNNPSRLA